MASVIPGYEYDIFISYRQKDNKGDKRCKSAPRIFAESIMVPILITFVLNQSLNH